ncbi:MAG: bifunctional nuclease family protein [Myxococcota bacterium]
MTLTTALASGLCGACGPASDPGPEPIEVRVGGIGLDPRTDSPVVVLRERDGARSLPIWIGTAEARSIAIGLESLELPRPNTHDLAKRLLASLDARLDRSVVTSLLDGTYYAVMVLETGDRHLEIDARPSDAIAIALRMGAPLYVSEGLLEPPPDRGEAPEEGEELSL